MGALYRISRDPVTGELVRTMLTDFGVGPNTGRNPVAVAVEADGHILVLNGSGGTTGIPVANRAVLVRIDPVTGARTIVSDFGDSGQGGLGVEPRGVAVEAGGSILVIDAQAGIGERVRGRVSSSGSIPRPGSAPPSPTSVPAPSRGRTRPRSRSREAARSW